MSCLYRCWYDIWTWFPVISSPGLIIYHSDMMTPTGTGYLQQKFSTFCPLGCGIKEITKETLGLRKLAVDLASGTTDSFLAWVALQNSLRVLSHIWSRGTLFNPSSPMSGAISAGIKANICKRAKVSSPSQSAFVKENSVVDIIRFAEYSLSTLKGRILASQVGPSRRLCVWKLHYLSPICTLISLSPKELQEYWVPMLMTKFIQWN